MRKRIKFFNSFISAAVLIVLSFLVYGEMTIPGEFIVPENTGLELGEFFTLVNVDKKNEQGAAEEKAVNLTSVGVNDSTYSAQVKLFGVFPLKTTKITSTQRQYVVPSGEIFGLRLYSDGLIVVGLDDVDIGDERVSPATLAGLKTGDIIKSVNGKELKRIGEFTEVIEKSGGGTLSLNIVRAGKGMDINFTPVIAALDGKYKAGMWLRDSSAGIGTLTFYDRNTGMFAGLGHAVCDVDTMELIPLSGGDALTAVINGCYKGTNGATGELCGTFGNKVIGSLMINGTSGVYGMLDSCDRSAKALPVATRQEIKLGPAQIISTVDNEGPRYYNIEIVKINMAADANERNMTIEIKDEALIEKTGGIVQGMSGSPIIQDGYFVGAVTHVFLNNCVQGYGIFAENMMKTCEELTLALEQKAA